MFLHTHLWSHFPANTGDTEETTVLEGPLPFGSTVLPHHIPHKQQASSPSPTAPAHLLWSRFTCQQCYSHLCKGSTEARGTQQITARQGQHTGEPTGSSRNILGIYRAQTQDAAVVPIPCPAPHRILGLLAAKDLFLLRYLRICISSTSSQITSLLLVSKAGPAFQASSSDLVLGCTAAQLRNSAEIVFPFYSVHGASPGNSDNGQWGSQGGWRRKKGHW